MITVDVSVCVRVSWLHNQNAWMKWSFAVNNAIKNVWISLLPPLIHSSGQFCWQFDNFGFPQSQLNRIISKLITMIPNWNEQFIEMHDKSSRKWPEILCSELHIHTNSDITPLLPCDFYSCSVDTTAAAAIGIHQQIRDPAMIQLNRIRLYGTHTNCCKHA